MKKILIIDDNSIVRTTISDIIKAHGYDTVEAESGAQGIQSQKDNPADLVISDLCMPEKSGIDTIRELRSQYPNLKIIAISGGPGSENVTGFSIYEQMLQAATQAGASKTLKKPIPAEELMNEIQALLYSNHLTTPVYWDRFDRCSISARACG